MTGLSLVAANFEAKLGVGGFTTTRAGGVSTGVYASLNLGDHVGDRPDAVAENRRRAGEFLAAQAKQLPAALHEPFWLSQCHGTVVARAEACDLQAAPPRADAAVCRSPGRTLAVLSADCLPVLLVCASPRVIGVAHAGWRGLASGVIENTLAAMNVKAADIYAWLGPAIGSAHFEVGAEVRKAFLSDDAGAGSLFEACAENKWHADLAGLASRRLERIGVGHITAANRCTYSEPDVFFSYRRDGECGRMATLLWMEPG